MKAVILLPSDYPSGPVKGGVALANGLIKHSHVMIIFIKRNKEKSIINEINNDIQCVYLDGGSFGIIKNFFNIKKIYKNFGNSREIFSISMCFMPDLYNVFLCGEYVTCCSVRANNKKNYKSDYGYVGEIYAYIHSLFYRSADYIVAMNKSMADDLKITAGVSPIIIGNFIDEDMVNEYLIKINQEKSHSLDQRCKFIFVGSLTKRKRPELLLDAFKTLIDNGFDVELNYLGSGPLEVDLRKKIEQYHLDKHVKIHGWVEDPLAMVFHSDVFVLPSESEGTSRASLEALALGVHCVLRDVDGNSELINNSNGALFSSDEELADTMIKVMIKAKKKKFSKSLLPEENVQSYCVGEYIKLFNNHNPKMGCK